MKIIVINGMPRAGKDEFVKMCQKHCHWCFNFSTVDFVKEVATQCGWDGTKTPKNRKFLSDLKDLLTQWNDVPYKKIEHEIQFAATYMKNYDFDPNTDGIAFIHCREPKEIHRFVTEMGASTLLIRRPEIENKEQSNHADADVFDYPYHCVIRNDGTLEELEGKAYLFLTKMGINNLQK
jgi:hypothetical protein